MVSVSLCTGIEEIYKLAKEAGGLPYPVVDILLVRSGALYIYIKKKHLWNQAGSRLIHADHRGKNVYRVLQESGRIGNKSIYDFTCT